MNYIIEKSNNGLFENEIELQGIYAKKLKELKEDIGLFNTIREGYILSILIGYLNNVNTIDTNEYADRNVSIFASDLNPRKKDLKFIYRIIMLAQEDSSMSVEDYMNRTFRDDTDIKRREYLKRNMNIINEYAVKGIEFLYDKFSNCHDKEILCDTLYKYVNDFAIDVGEKEEVELPEFEPNFE